jgi:hypothetical protein
MQGDCFMYVKNGNLPAGWAATEFVSNLLISCWL